MRKWLPALFIVGSWAFSIAVFSRLPESVPVHWGASGEPNRYGSRFEAAFLMPAIMLMLFGVLMWYPSRDPRAANIAKFRGAYDAVVAATLAFIAGVHVIALGKSLGWQIPLNTVILAGVGVLFVLVGNLLPRARSP